MVESSFLLMVEGSFLRATLSSRNLILGATLTLTFAVGGLMSFLWTPYDVTLLDIPSKLQKPSAAHLFGTDHFGRDIFSMIMVGARTSIAVALVAVGIGMGIGVPLGLAAAAQKRQHFGRGHYARQ